MKLTLCILIALFALMIAVMLCYAGEKYQTYQRDSLFNALNVHHFFTQSRDGKGQGK